MLALKKLIQPNLLRISRRISTSAQLAHGDLVVHRDSKENNEETPFEFTVANMYRIASLMRYNYPFGCERSVIAFAVDLAQRQYGWVPISAMNKVAEVLNIPRIRVYEWSTFYTMTNRRYRGIYHVKVCKTTPCMLRGADYIVSVAEKVCRCPVGALSQDGMFGVDTVECAGACANACVVAINDDYYEDLTEQSLTNIIECLKNGGIPRQGPQSCRSSCEPMTGQTTLLNPPPYAGYMLQPALRVSQPPPPPLATTVTTQNK